MPPKIIPLVHMTIKNWKCCIRVQGENFCLHKGLKDLNRGTAWHALYLTSVGNVHYRDSTFKSEDVQSI